MQRNEVCQLTIKILRTFANFTMFCYCGAEENCSSSWASTRRAISKGHLLPLHTWSLMACIFMSFIENFSVQIILRVQYNQIAEVMLSVIHHRRFEMVFMTIRWQVTEWHKKMYKKPNRKKNIMVEGSRHIIKLSIFTYQF